MKSWVSPLSHRQSGFDSSYWNLRKPSNLSDGFHFLTILKALKVQDRQLDEPIVLGKAVDRGGKGRNAIDVIGKFIF
jgi:hypothetical protein